jgi:hypothetical protein
VGAVVVVDVDERVELACSSAMVVGCGLGAQPFLHRELEAFDFAARGGVVGAGVLLADPEFDEFVLEAVA